MTDGEVRDLRTGAFGRRRTGVHLAVVDADGHPVELWTSPE